MSVHLWLLPLYILPITIFIEWYLHNIGYKNGAILWFHLKLSFYYYIVLVGYHFISKFW